MKPYYQHAGITVYHADFLEVLPSLDPVDAIITAPPYGETDLRWDVWPTGWPGLMVSLAPQLWCFGSMRMFMARISEFEGWRQAQEIIWEKHNGSGSHSDRFRRVHEIAVHFYRGEWCSLYHVPPVTNDAHRRRIARVGKPGHWGGIGSHTFESEEGGPRLMRSVIPVRSCHGSALHPTQKPEGIIRPLVEYSVPRGGIILDPFVGSGTTLVVAKETGRRAIGIEMNEAFCEIAAERLQQEVLIQA